jgi:hypothetical protein
VNDYKFNSIAASDWSADDSSACCCLVLNSRAGRPRSVFKNSFNHPDAKLMRAKKLICNLPA